MPKNYLTFRQLDQALIARAGLSANEIEPALRQMYINDKLMKVFRLLDGLDDPWYDRSTAVAAAGDGEVIVETDITSITASTDTIVLSGGKTLTAGQIIGVAIFSTGGAHIADFIARVLTGGATATYTVLVGSDADKSTNKATILKIASPAASTFDISSLYVHEVKRLYDGSGATSRAFTRVTDPDLFTQLPRNPFFDKRVAYLHRGDTLLLYVGASATALSSPYMEYRGKPSTYTDASEDNVVDIPPETNQILFDECLAEFLQHAGKQVPDDVTARLAHVQKLYEAAAANMQKKAAEKGKVS